MIPVVRIDGDVVPVRQVSISHTARPEPSHLPLPSSSNVVIVTGAPVNIREGDELRVTVSGTVMFRGFVDSSVRRINQARTAITYNVSAIDDITRTIGQAVDRITPGVGEGETTGARVDRLLDLADPAPPNSRRDLDAGFSTLVATNLDTGSIANELRRVILSEAGTMWRTKNGVLTFRQRGHAHNVRANVWGDTDPALRYRSLEVATDADQAFNHIAIGRRTSVTGQVIQTREQTASIGRIGKRSHEWPGRRIISGDAAYIEAAETHSVALDDEGFAIPPGTAARWWNQATGDTDAADMTNYIRFLVDVGMPDPATMAIEAETAVADQQFPPAISGAEVKVDSTGAIRFWFGAGTAAFPLTDTACDLFGKVQRYFLDLPGMNVPAGLLADDVFTRYGCEFEDRPPSRGPKPITLPGFSDIDVDNNTDHNQVANTLDNFMDETETAVMVATAGRAGVDDEIQAIELHDRLTVSQTIPGGATETNTWRVVSQQHEWSVGEPWTATYTMR